MIFVPPVQDLVFLAASVARFRQLMATSAKQDKAVSGFPARGWFVMLCPYDLLDSLRFSSIADARNALT
jgi:hypothetical protein